LASQFLNDLDGETISNVEQRKSVNENNKNNKNPSSKSLIDKIRMLLCCGVDS